MTLDRTCPDCDGLGVIEETTGYAGRQRTVMVTCAACNGEEWQVFCESCDDWHEPAACTPGTVWRTRKVYRDGRWQWLRQREQVSHARP